MRPHPSIRALLLAGVSLLLLGASTPDPGAVLSARHRPGDRYALVLETATVTEARSNRSGVEPFHERVEQVYRADVEVLEVDAAGRPVRERHEHVRVTGARGAEKASLFEGDVHYEVERRDGGVRIRLEEPGESDAVERIVTPLLEVRLGGRLGAELLDPGREVAMGEPWGLSERLARRLLRADDLRAVRFDGEPTAVLRPHPSDAALVSLHYTIPVASFELRDLPANGRASRSRARVEGRIDLAPDASWPVAHETTFELHVAGAVDTRGAARPFGWSLDRSERSIERIRVLDRVVPEPASLAPGPARFTAP